MKDETITEYFVLGGIELTFISKPIKYGFTIYMTEHTTSQIGSFADHRTKGLYSSMVLLMSTTNYQYVSTNKHILWYFF